MITTSIINRKGGTGKTITTTNLAYKLSEMGYKVLLIDADSQRDLSKIYRASRNARTTICNVLDDPKTIWKGIRNTKYDQLNILPGDEGLEIMHDIDPHSLSVALEEMKNEFDFCLIDCPPSMQITTVSALIASDYVIAPMKLDAFSSGGVFAIDKLIEQCREYNQNIEFLGALITMYRPNKNANRMVEDLIFNPPFPIMDTVIRYDTAVDRSTVSRKPLAKCAKNGKAAEDYENLALEFLRKVEV